MASSAVVKRTSMSMFDAREDDCQEVAQVWLVIRRDISPIRAGASRAKVNSRPSLNASWSPGCLLSTPRQHRSVHTTPTFFDVPTLPTYT
jgi:hypothetical protein